MWNPDTPATLDRILRVAREAATTAGEILMRHLRDGISMRDKTATGGASYDLVSDADLESELAVAAAIRAAFPNHSLLAEESHGADLDIADAEHLWIVDPLDGTNNYAHRLPHFAVSIAYYHRGTAMVGVIHNPASGDWFTAVRGRGAAHNDRPVRVSEAMTLSKCLVGCGFYYDRGEMMRRTLAAIEHFFSHQIHGIRRFGTASLDLCMVGCGQFGGFFEYKLSPWDFAAGRLFVEEAGGLVTDANGRSLPLAVSSILASNGHLHEEMLAITRKHHP